LQAYAVPENRDTFSLVVPHAVFYRMKSEILSAKVAHDEALLDWFVGVLGGTYTNAADPRSLAAAARASAAGRVLALLLESSPTQFRPILDQVGVFRTRLPAVYLEWQREGSETGMPTELVQSPQRFQVRARIELLGATNLNGIQVALRLPPNQTVLRVLGETIQAVRFPLADDGKPGPVSLAWDLEYVGSFLESSVEFDLEVLELGSVPLGFVANSVSARILVAPEVRDRDLDGMPDTFEAMYGLNPTEDDRNGDRDGDRLTNGEEFLWGTRPDLADSDGDALSDREELVPGADGVRSSPTHADSDADGVADAGDGAPFDAGSTQVSGEPGRIDWSLDRARVTLTRAEPAALVAIRSTPPGALRWRAEVEDPTLVEASPTYGSVAATSSAFLVGLPAGFRWPTSGTYSTRVRVRNEADPLAGSTDLEVWVQADFASAVTAHLSENRDSLVLEWEAVAGMRYTVEGSDDLQTWTKSTIAPVAVGTRSLRWSEPRAVIEGAGRGRFYRVLAQPR
ncbi:MAG: hypothetical protein IT580_14200, partial [Verrucomicrobiales bacterium]|nr:hypothetical protein [Verrucomicrobiales bacterium]